MSLDLSGTRETTNIPSPENIPSAPQPTRLILVKAGIYSGVLQNGLAVRGTQLYRDSNPANVRGNPNGYWPTYGHLFTTIGGSQLFDMTDMNVYDLRAYDTNTLVVVFP
jgi:hypothetical protein